MPQLLLDFYNFLGWTKLIFFGIVRKKGTSQPFSVTKWLLEKLAFVRLDKLNIPGGHYFQTRPRTYLIVEEILNSSTIYLVVMQTKVKASKHKNCKIWVCLMGIGKLFSREDGADSWGKLFLKERNRKRGFANIWFLLRWDELQFAFQDFVPTFRLRFLPEK